MQRASIPMEKPGKIIRKSIYTFLQNYQYFTSIAAVLVLPYAISILLAQAFVLSSSSSSLLPSTYNHLRILFDAAGFPTSSKFFSIFIQKLSQTVSSSIYSLPLSLTFLLISKASVIQALNQQKPNLFPCFSSIISLYNPLLRTHVCNSLLIISANATVFFLLFFAFNCLEGFHIFSVNCLQLVLAAGALLYSIVIAKTFVICTLASVLSGMEKSGGFLAVLRAWVLMQGRTTTALSLALPVNLALAAIEALFQYRIVGAYHFGKRLAPSVFLEGILVAYLYSNLLVLDTIVYTMFFKSCKAGHRRIVEGKSSLWIDISEKENENHSHLKDLEELP